MKRRTFFLSGLAATTALVAWQFVNANDEDTIVMVVRKRLDYLKLDAEGVQQFARDLVALHAVSKLRLRVLSNVGPIYTRTSMSAGDNTLSYLLRHGEDRIVSAYLISSDFFVNAADETRVVKYLGMFDSSHPCGNPFARSPA